MRDYSTLQAGLGALTLVALGLVYLLPTLIAAARDAEGLSRIVRRNVLLGWSVVVWCQCLIGALRCPRAVEHRQALRLDSVPDWIDALPPHPAWRALPRDTAPFRPGGLR